MSILKKLTFCIMVTVFAASCTTISSETKKIVVAHRGGASLGPENALSTINKGIAVGSDMIEVDVHMTIDSQLVVCHDQTVNRTTNGRGRIENMTLSDIRSLRLDGSDETMPTLEEVLLAIKGRCLLLLEIKKRRDQYVGIERKVVEMLEAYEMTDQVIIQSFNKYVLEEIIKLNPELRIELLTYFPPRHPERYRHITSFNVCHFFVTNSFVNRVHKLGREVKIWTVDHECRSTRLPIDGVITNNPEVFL